MKKLIIATALLISNAAAFSQTNWGIDKAHSSVKFSVTHLVISEVDGSFKLYDGKITSTSPDFDNSKVEFTVDVSSINTDNDMRDKHLKSDDFFNAEKFPQMKFKSTSFKKVSGNKYKLEGDMTIRDITKRVSFDVTYGGSTKDSYGNNKAGFSAKGTINRFDYNLKWNSVTDAGSIVVEKDVKISVNLELAQQK